MHSPGFPPRGSGVPGRPETAPSETWAHPSQLGPSWDWKPGKVLLGKWENRLLGRDDDRHVVTVAGSRAGKSSTVLIPNLLRYPGSVLVLDPKGELARATAAQRRRMGQRVYVLDPFGETGVQSGAGAAHNPFAELGQGRPEHIAADAAQLADALIIGNPRDPHWTDSAKNLVRGIALHLLATEPANATMRELRRLLNATPHELDQLFTAMGDSSAFDGIVANVGASFLGKKEAGGRELQSILSTAQEQTSPLDDIIGITERSDFHLSELQGGNVSLYLVLPGMRMGTHYRWLRLIIQQALAAMERAPVARGQLPVWFVLEEFPSLGHMRSIETAAGLMAGFGVKLWSVLQDLTQPADRGARVLGLAHGLAEGGLRAHQGLRSRQHAYRAVQPRQGGSAAAHLSRVARPYPRKSCCRTGPEAEDRPATRCARSCRDHMQKNLHSNTRARAPQWKLQECLVREFERVLGELSWWRALRHAPGALFEPLCFENGLGRRRGQERDQTSCGVSLLAASNNAGSELGVVLNRWRQRASEFDGWLSQDFADLIESDLNVAVGNACVQHFRRRR